MKHNKMIIEIGVGELAKDYILEIDRKSVIFGEEVLGYNITQVGDRIISQAYKAFAMALQKNHKDIKVEERDDLLDKYVSEGGDLTEIVEFTASKVSDFLQPTNTSTKANKKKKTRFE